MDTNAHEDLINEMRRELDALRSEVEQLRATKYDGLPPADIDEIGPAKTTAGSRRALIRGAAAAGAGLTVAALASRPAAAADNDPILIGNSNTGSTNTSLSTTALEGLRATTSNTTGFASGLVGEASSSSSFVIGVQGRALNSPDGRGVRGDGHFGVEGTTVDADGEGVRGFAFNPGGTGVVAIADGTTGTGLGSDSRAASPDGIAAKATNSATTGTALGVSAESASATGTAVLGAATSTGTSGTIGVRGTAASQFGIGVDGRNERSSGSTIGVRGTSLSPTGQGVFGVTTSGIGVLGVAEEPGGLGAQFRGPRAALFVQSSGTAAPRLLTDPHTAGEIQLDAGDNLWVCVESGTPGTWRLVAGPGSAGAVNVINPYRALDTRFVDGPIGVGESLIVSVKDAIDIEEGTVTQTDVIPEGATAVFFNLTAAGPVGSGFLATTPGDATTFGSSTVNWSGSGTAVANGSLVKLDDDRKMKVFAGGVPGAEAEVIIDITGYTV